MKNHPPHPHPSSHMSSQSISPRIGVNLCVVVVVAIGVHNSINKIKMCYFFFSLAHHSERRSRQVQWKKRQILEKERWCERVGEIICFGRGKYVCTDCTPPANQCSWLFSLFRFFFFVEPDAVQSFANALFISARHFMEYEIVEALNEFVCAVCFVWLRLEYLIRKH